MINYLSKAGGVYIVSKIKTLLQGKVDKVEGKGLSSVDFSAEYETKLNGIAEGANKTVTDTDLNASSTNPIQNKVVNTALGKKANLASPTFTGTPKAPTAVASTNSQQIATTAFVQTVVAAKIADAVHLKFQTVTQLPTTGDSNTIYRIKNGSNYDEYMWIDNKWDKIGSSAVDLTGYVKESDLVEVTNAEIDAMFV